MKRLIAIAAFTMTATSATAQDLPGYDRLDVAAAHRANPVAASVWYPAGHSTHVVKVGDDALFTGRPALMGAAVAPGQHPLVLLSHGSGGNMDALAWLSSGLVQRGAMVLAVNHPGSTSGDSSPRRSMYLGQRAADLRAALDQVLANPDFAGHVDTSRIAALGFSLGGTTALTLAGWRFDPEKMTDLCTDAPKTGAGCEFFQNGGVDFSRLPDDFSAAAGDPRITRTIAVDPGFTQALDTGNGADTPILLLNLGTTDTLWSMVDTGPTGTDLANRLPDAQHKVIAPAHHFTFLAECKPGGEQILAEEGDEAICSDPEGTDRGGVHAAIIEEVAEFLDL